MTGQSGIFLLVATILIASFIGFSSAIDYTVGGNFGWNIPPNSTFYPNWISQQNFQVGDVLVFNFPAQQHTVAEVSRAAYDSCNTTNLLSRAVTTPPARITLTTAGTHYFICTIPGHCRFNQSLSVVVTGPSTTPTPAPQPSSRPSPQPGAIPPPTSPALSTPPPSTSTDSPPPPTTADAPATPTARGAGSAPPPEGSFAAPTTAGVGLLTVVSVATAALLF